MGSPILSKVIRVFGRENLKNEVGISFKTERVLHMEEKKRCSDRTWKKRPRTYLSVRKLKKQ